MKIALIGTRGIPAQYGGFETCAEELSQRLVQSGHEVWVYCRANYYSHRPQEYLRIKLIYINEPKSKFLETLVHTLKSLWHARRFPYDIILVFNSGNAPSLVLPLLYKKKVALHMDGMEWKRGKWGRLARSYHRFSRWLATKLPIDMINDSRELQKYYQSNFGKESTYLSYGAPIQSSQNPELLKQFDIEPGEYFFQLTRFEPENSPLLTVKAFERTNTSKKLVMVGGVTYPTPYAQEIHATQDNRIKLLGFLYDKDILRELYCNCYAYIHGNEVGGTNPALLEAMASGCFVICRDVAFNREVLRDAGIYYEKTVPNLTEKIQWALDNPDGMDKQKANAINIIKENYSWDKVAMDYTALFKKMLKT